MNKDNVYDIGVKIGAMLSEALDIHGAVEKEARFMEICDLIENEYGQIKVAESIRTAFRLIEHEGMEGEQAAEVVNRTIMQGH